MEKTDGKDDQTNVVGIFDLSDKFLRGQREGEVEE